MDLSVRTTYEGGYRPGQLVATNGGTPDTGIQVAAKFVEYTSDRREQWVGVVLLDRDVVYELPTIHGGHRQASAEATKLLAGRLAALLSAR